MFRSFVIWALLTLVIESQTVIRVQGLDQNQTKIALQKMAGRLTYVRSRPAAPSRADDAAFLMKRHLILEGFRQVDVDWKLPGDGSILLIVSKGPQYTLGTIQIQNATVADPEKHRDYFLQPFVNRKNTEQDRYPYLREDYLDGIDNLQNYLRSQGYWKAKVSAAEPKFDSQTQRVFISLTEIPGPQFKLALPDLQVKGAEIPEQLREQLRQQISQIASTENINKVRATVQRTFENLGFPFLELSMQQENIGALTQLTFKLNTGKRYHVGKVTVSGNKRTDTRHIRRRFKELQGEEFERKKADERIRKLLSTGAFTSIQLDEKAQEDGSLDFHLTVDEAKSYGVKVYAGAGSLEGPIFGAGYFDRNLWQQLYSLEVDFEFSGLGLLGEISLTDPFFLERDLAWKNRAFILTRNYDGFRKFESGVESSLSWEVNDYYDVRLGLGISYVDLEPRGGLTREELGNTSYVDNRLTLSQTYDRRNDKALPTKGYIAQLDTKFGFAAGNDSISYFANELRYTWYHEINQDSRFALGARLGSVEPLGDDTRLPIDLRYFIGGANSVRSFRERQLGPEVNGEPIGGTSYFIANAEYIRTLTGVVKGVAFLDAGGLSSDLDFGFGDPRFAAGLGIQLDLPIGPVRFEYGHALNRQNNEHRGTFHFSIGTAF